MAKNNNLKDFLTDVADAIREKKGTTEPINPQNFYSEIASIESGGGGDVEEAQSKLVNFIDYDGRIFYSCNTIDENVDPPFPVHKGLIAQDYSESVGIIMSLINQNPNTIGVSYITDDGKTRLYIRIDTNGRMNVPIRFKQDKVKGVAVDWGDGSDVEYFNGTGNVGMTHKYSEIGNYVITLDPSDDCTLNLGNGNSSYCVMGPTANASKIYSNMLIKAEIGRNVLSLDNYAFYGCTNLESVTIPQEVTSFGTYVFRGCLSLRFISIPSAVKTIGTYSFYDCRSLRYIAMGGVLSYPSNSFYNCHSLLRIKTPSTTTIDSYAFYNCISLTSVRFAGDVTSIGSNAFYTCYGIGYYDFSKCTKIPSLTSNNAFTGITSDCKIIVPDDLYDSWKSATNWSSHISKIIKKSDWDASLT